MVLRETQKRVGDIHAMRASPPVVYGHAGL